MRKLLLCSTVFLLVVSCHIKKDSELLAEHFTKASNEVISIDERKEANQKALDLVLQSKNQQDSLFFKNVFKIAKAYELIGNYYKKQIPDSAYLYYTQAQKYYTIVQNKENIGKILLNKAEIQYNDGDLIRSEMFCLEALKLFNFLKDKKQKQRYLYDTYNFFGVLANDQQEYHKALSYHNKALQILIQDNNMKSIELLKSTTLNNIGIVYRNRNENKEALSYFAQALETKELTEKAPHLYAMLLDNTAYSRFKLGNNTGIQDLFYNALFIRENLNLVPGIVMSKLHMSEYYHQQKDTKKALQLAQEAYDLTKTKKIDPRDVMRLLKQLQQVNELLKDIYTTEYNHIADSLQQATPKIHETITQELAQAEAKEEAKAKKKEKIKTVLVELGVIVCFIGVNYVINQREKRRVRRSEEQSVKKQAELEDQIKIYNLALKQKNNDTGNHCFVDILHNLLNEQKKYITINEYIDEGITWDDVGHAIMIHLYHIIEDFFKAIDRNKQISFVNIEIFEGEKTGLILNIDCYGEMSSTKIIEEKFITSSLNNNKIEVFLV